MASSSVGGLSGAFIPVSEDAGMIDAAEVGTLTLEKLEAMTAAVLPRAGYDRGGIPRLIPSPLSSPMKLSYPVWSTPRAVRVILPSAHEAGEVLDFGGLLGTGPIMKINRKSSSVMIQRGGRIPAPMQSLEKLD